MSEYCLQYAPSRCTARLYTHARTNQPSTVTTLTGSGTSNERILIGAHEDSTASGNSAPGSDDDGSGSVTVMEAMRAFLEAGLDNDITIEFQTYAAEEVGLWGSADIAADYANSNVAVRGMLQFDMNGCCSASSGLNRGTRYSICTDAAFTDTALTNRLRSVISSYGDLPSQDFTYGRAASDHASFARNGFPAAHVKEDVSYQPIHTANDVYGNIDFDYLESFVKIALGFAIEESGA